MEPRILEWKEPFYNKLALEVSIGIEQWKWNGNLFQMSNIGLLWILTIAGCGVRILVRVGRGCGGHLRLTWVSRLEVKWASRFDVGVTL